MNDNIAEIQEHPIAFAKAFVPERALAGGFHFFFHFFRRSLRLPLVAHGRQYEIVCDGCQIGYIQNPDLDAFLIGDGFADDIQFFLCSQL